jgi:hypothetical protein
MTDHADTVAGVLLVAVPLAFNAAFAGLAATFDYPDVLRRPTGEVLERFRAGGSRLVTLWWAFAMTAVCMVPLVVLLGHANRAADPALVGVATAIGVLAALVQFLGLARWPFLVPYLARAEAAEDATPERRAAIDVTFQAANRFLGVAVGEHLGYLLSGIWTVLTACAIWDGGAVPGWLGDVGILSGAALVVCAFEFVGPNEPGGWRVAERLTPPAYVVWSLWLVAVGIALLV